MNYLLFKRWNDFSGWMVFLIAAFVYGMTIEPTASFWDCPEFISCAEKLQVGHPPGAPFYMLVGNLFTQFASDATQVSRMVNFLNALLSAGCILFLFWSITRLVRYLLKEEKGELSITDVIIILGSGLVGALAYTFSDTFWFSAVEGEVYAFSSFLTALVFWMILRWQDESDSVCGDRWIILIAYIIGLSIGVHLLNLLCIPAIVLVFYYQKYQTISLKGVIGAITLSGLLIVLILFVYIPGVADMGGWFELLLVNVLGFPFQSGLIIFLALVVFLLIVAIYRFRKRIIHTTLWCMLALTMGYTTYAVILIRASANTPLNENAPDNIFTLKSYLNREQYESAPLLYGRTYSSEPEYVPEGDYYKVKTKKGGAVYRQDKEEGKYKIIRHKEDICYTQNMLFPRMWNDRLASSYQSWSGGTDKVPTQKENLTYFITYQLNYMYWRYFLWNFVGRQNDMQGHGGPEYGNWITGISWLDNVRLGDQKLLPESLRQNKGHNVFYGLPLILGLIGIYWQLVRGKRGKQQFSIVFFLFFMTGLAIVLYLNQTPGQPRERDYAYAGSFYAFAIWIGMGAAGLCDTLRKKKNSVLPISVSMLLCLLIPVQMASQTWDDHDRSNRYTCRDFGANYLMTLPDKGHPIIFCNGDNDTFPLWYNQETEGFRTDARTCNLSYLQTDWYIDQMKRPAYDSPSLPITWDRVEYVEGQNEYIPIRPEVKKNIDQMYAQADSALENGNPEVMNELKEQFGENPYELKNILKYWVRSDKEGLRVIPTDSIVMKIDKEAVRRSGMKIPEALGDSIPEYMTILLRDANGSPKRALYKSELMMLEMLANANWERPIYMAITVGSENHLGMDNHFMQEGLAYRFTPFDTDKLNSKINSEKMYDNLMNKFKFGGIEKPGIYIDENVMRMCYTHRRIFTQLVGQLIKEGKKDKALAALDYAEKMIPSYNVPYDWANGAFQMAEAYYQLGQNEKANKIIDELANKSLEYMVWYLSLTDYQLSIASENFMYNAGLLDAEVRLMEKYKSEDLAKHYSEQLDQLYSEYVARMKGK